MWRLLLWFVAISCLAGGRLQAQQAPTLTPGDLIRLETADLGRVMGRVQSLTADELVFRVPSRNLPFTVPLAEITMLERSRSVTRRQSAWTGAKWGALVGAIPGALSLGLQHEQVGKEGSSVAKAATLGAFSGGLFGGLIGAAVGAGRAGDRWERLEPSLLIGTGGSARLSLSFAF